MDKINRILAFLRITDANDNNISLTSLAIYISLFRLATTPQASYSDIGALVTTLGAHAYKKFINKDAQKGPTDV